jgi:integrase
MASDEIQGAHVVIVLRPAEEVAVAQVARIRYDRSCFETTQARIERVAVRPSFNSDRSLYNLLYTTRALQMMFKDAANRAQLPAHYSIHGLRHSWGTYLYQKTKNLRLVQKELRHRSPQTTAVYADVTPEERSEAVNGVWDD